MDRNTCIATDFLTIGVKKSEAPLLLENTGIATVSPMVGDSIICPGGEATSNMVEGQLPLKDTETADKNPWVGNTNFWSEEDGGHVNVRGPHNGRLTGGDPGEAGKSSVR